MGRNVERGERKVERYGGREWDEEGIVRGEKKAERPG